MARDFVASALDMAGFTGDTDTVLLLVSELVTNAVRHAATPFEILVDVQRDEVRIAVTDEDVTHGPTIKDPSPEDTNGRGLLIVDRLASGWGTEQIDQHSKSVWFTLN